MPFTLTEGQARAQQMVSGMLGPGGDGDARFGILTGYAGTGKTTMLRVLAEDHGPPLVLAPTGKAALRVREATGLDASTIHRWMYAPYEDPKTGDVRWRKRPLDDVSVPPNRFVVIDESSMLGPELWADIWSMCSALGVRVLLVGDRFQLPPVTKVGDAPFSALTNLRTEHRADLTEVVRQALDSPIVRASMMVRQGELEAVEAVGDLLESVPREYLAMTFLSFPGSKAMIAHRNATRHELNLEVRRALRMPEDELRPGEPLLVLLNNYAIDRFNGEVVGFEGWDEPPCAPVAVRDRWRNASAMVSYGVARVEGTVALVSQEEVFGQTQALPVTTVSRAARQYAVDNWGYERAAAPSHLNANLGYCLTCHKSQGSEWDDVLVVVEGSVGGSGGLYGREGRRWLYTAITRARRGVKLCLT